MVELISVIQSGQRIFEAQFFQDFRLFFDFSLVFLNTLIQILICILPDLCRKSHILLRHFGTGIGDMDMAAAGRVIGPAEDGGNTLMGAQINAGGGISGNPRSAAANEYVR